MTPSLAGLLAAALSAAPLETLHQEASLSFDGAPSRPPVVAAAAAQPRFHAERVVPLDTARGRPAFLSFADLDGDGAPELVVSQFAASGPFGAGRVDAYRMTRPGDPASFQRRTAMDGVRFPNAVSAEDLDGDGDADLIVPSGFLACMPTACGGLSVVENTPAGWQPRRLLERDRFFYHRVLRADFDDDGVRDWLTVGERKGLSDPGESRVFLYPGPGHARAVDLGAGLGSLPIALDMDGDGDLDVASAEYFGAKASFAWLENLGGRRFEHRAIDASSGGAIQLSAVPNLFGDGRTVLVGSNHTNQADGSSAPESGVFVFEPGEDPRRPWSRRLISDGIRSRPSNGPAKQGAPGIFAWGDADGDGDLDIAVHGDGDPRVFLLEQASPGRFVTHVLASEMGQGGVAMADLDGDGAAEVAVSSYEKDVLAVLSWKRPGRAPRAR